MDFTIGELMALSEPFFGYGQVHPLFQPCIDGKLPCINDEESDFTSDYYDSRSEFATDSDFKGVASDQADDQKKLVVYEVDFEQLSMTDTRQRNNNMRRSIMPLLDKYELSSAISQRANQIYLSMRPITHRGRKLIQLLYFCSYCACLELGLHEDIAGLDNIFGLNHKEVQQVNSMFSPVQTGYVPSRTHMTALDLLPSQCKQLGFDDDTSLYIVKFAGELIQKYLFLRQAGIETTAAACLYYYAYKHGVMVPQEMLEEVTKRSHTTIKTMYDNIIAAELS